MTFLHVLTRCYRRPAMLHKNMAMLAQQTDPDYEQTCIVDCVGMGVGAANAQLAEWGDRLRGEYIWILDDDDMCVWPPLIATLKRTVKDKPDVIMLTMDHGGELGVQPDSDHWGEAPVQGHIGVSAYIVRRDIWQAHAGAWAGGHYASDFDFISAIWDAKPKIVGLDIIASACQRISHGEPE